MLLILLAIQILPYGEITSKISSICSNPGVVPCVPKFYASSADVDDSIFWTLRFGSRTYQKPNGNWIGYYSYADSYNSNYRWSTYAYNGVTSYEVGGCSFGLRADYGGSGPAYSSYQQYTGYWKQGSGYQGSPSTLGYDRQGTYWVSLSGGRSEFTDGVGGLKLKCVLEAETLTSGDKSNKIGSEEGWCLI